MPITFNCPQGHRLTCPDELAGKPGKCPKCGVVVRVPAPASPIAATAHAGDVETAPDEPASALYSAADGATPSELGIDQIIFLCPNGHRLHGAASLAGRPGQCPHCGVKFLVPSPDEDDEEPDRDQEPADEALNGIVIQIDTSGKGGSSKTGRKSSPSGTSPSASAHPLAGLLAQLQRYKNQGVSIEIHLGDGKLIEPEQFSLKDAQHAFFASREANGTHTMTVVAWSSIERVVVRGLEQLPREWFA
jgi:rRNA maturation protein Nop10